MHASTRAYLGRSNEARDGFRESIIRCGVKIDNGLEKPNQDLKKAEKVKNSDQTSGSNLRARYTLTTARGRCVRARASLFVAKLWRRCRSTRTTRIRGSEKT
jgi:hypothetical protein